MSANERETPDDSIDSSATQPNTQDDTVSANPQPTEHWGCLDPLIPGSDMMRIMFSNEPEQKIGRSKDCSTVCLDSSKMSRTHAKIVWDGVRGPQSLIRITDFSNNGTWLANNRLKKNTPYLLTNGTVIAFGNNLPKTGEPDHRFIFRFLADDTPETGLYAEYKVSQHLLGSGGYAEVYKGANVSTDELVAIKMVRHAPLMTASTRPNQHSKLLSAAKKEVKAMERTQHLNICRLRAHFWEDELNAHSRFICYLVLDYIDGNTLLAKIKEVEGLEEAATRQIMWQLCNAVSFLHSRHIVHRDLKPENILLTNGPEPVVKVADFGLARIASSSHSVFTTPCGSPDYVAPEVCQVTGLDSNRPQYNRLADSFSLGVLLFVCLCNKLPFVLPGNRHDVARLDPHSRVLRRHWRWQALDHSEVFSPQVKSLVHSLVKMKPDQRISAEEALNHDWFNGYRPPPHHIPIPLPVEEEEEELNSQVSSMSMTDESNTSSAHTHSSQAQQSASQGASSGRTPAMPGAYNFSQDTISVPVHALGPPPPPSPTRRSQRMDDVLRDGSNTSSEQQPPATTTTAKDKEPIVERQGRLGRKGSLKRTISAVDENMTRSERWLYEGGDRSPSRNPGKQVVPERPAKTVKMS